MALDQALALHRQPGEGVLRFYRWVRPTLSFGRHQKPSLRYDPMALRARGVEAVRRPTGGREVLHDRELTYAVVAPAAGPGSLRLLYREINQALVHALNLLGVPAEQVPARVRVPSPDSGACFARPAPGEIVVGGAKLVGSAQLRMGPTILQHGSLLLRPSVVQLMDLARNGEPVVAQEGAYLEDLLGTTINLAHLMATLRASFAGTLGGYWSHASALRPEEEASLQRLETEMRQETGLWKKV